MMAAGSGLEGVGKGLLRDGKDGGPFFVEWKST